MIHQVAASFCNLTFCQMPLLGVHVTSVYHQQAFNMIKCIPTFLQKSQTCYEKKKSETRQNQFSETFAENMSIDFCVRQLKLARSVFFLGGGRDCQASDRC